MFKEGDIVWSTTDRYSVTFYHRPCKVVYIDSNTFRVMTLDSKESFNVDINLFELVPPNGMLKPGDVLIHNKTGETLIFVCYYDSCYIKCKDLEGLVKIYKIQEIESIKDKFYV